MKSLHKGDIIFAGGVIAIPSVLVAIGFLITSANNGNMVSAAVLLVVAVLLVGFMSNLSALTALFVNQKQDNQVLQNNRQAQDDVLITAKTMAQLMRTQQLQMKNQIVAPLPESDILYLDTASVGHIEGIYEDV